MSYLIRAGGMRVLISGCGHPRIEQILVVVEQVLDVPIRAVVGGLHLPVHAAGTPLVPQAVLGNPHPPWQPISERDAGQVLEQIEARGPRVIALPVRPVELGQLHQHLRARLAYLCAEPCPSPDGQRGEQLHTSHRRVERRLVARVGDEIEHLLHGRPIRIWPTILAMSHLHGLVAPARRQAFRLLRRRLCQTPGSGHVLASCGG